MAAKARRALVDTEPARVATPGRATPQGAGRCGANARCGAAGGPRTCALLVLMQLYLAIPLTPVVGQALASGGAAAALGTAYSLAYALGFLIFGPLSDRYGRKVILVPGMAAFAIATAALSLASSMTLVGVLRAVQGLLAASFAAVALAYIGEATPAALALHRHRRHCDILPRGRHRRPGLRAGGCPSPRLALGVRPGSARLGPGRGGPGHRPGRALLRPAGL